MLALHQKFKNLPSRYALCLAHCAINLPADWHNGQRENARLYMPEEALGIRGPIV